MSEAAKRHDQETPMASTEYVGRRAMARERADELREREQQQQQRRQQC